MCMCETCKCDVHPKVVIKRSVEEVLSEHLKWLINPGTILKIAKAIKEECMDV